MRPKFASNAYNRAVVTTSFVFRLWRAARATASLGLVSFLSLTLIATARGQAGDSAASGAGSSAGHGRILLVLPFDNRTGQPSLEWIREAAPEILGSRFQSAGFAPMSREDRLYALDHLGLPEGFHPSRATALKLAQCMRSHGVPNFPDGPITKSSGINENSPAFQRAFQSCKKYLTGLSGSSEVPVTGGS